MEGLAVISVTGSPQHSERSFRDMIACYVAVYGLRGRPFVLPQTTDPSKAKKQASDPSPEVLNNE